MRIWRLLWEPENRFPNNRQIHTTTSEFILLITDEQEAMDDLWHRLCGLTKESSLEAMEERGEEEVFSLDFETRFESNRWRKLCDHQFCEMEVQQTNCSHAKLK